MMVANLFNIFNSYNGFIYNRSLISYSNINLLYIIILILLGFVLVLYAGLCVGYGFLSLVVVSLFNIYILIYNILICYCFYFYILLCYGYFKYYLFCFYSSPSTSSNSQTGDFMLSNNLKKINNNKYYSIGLVTSNRYMSKESIFTKMLATRGLSTNNISNNNKDNTGSSSLTNNADIDDDDLYLIAFNKRFDNYNNYLYQNATQKFLNKYYSEVSGDSYFVFFINRLPVNLRNNTSVILKLFNFICKLNSIREKVLFLNKDIPKEIMIKLFKDYYDVRSKISEILLKIGMDQSSIDKLIRVLGVSVNYNNSLNDLISVDLEYEDLFIDS
jgi:hypothetical protein